MPPLRNVRHFFTLRAQPTRNISFQSAISFPFHVSGGRGRALIDTTPSSDEHLILYFSIDSSTVRSRLEGGSREVRDVDAGSWGDEGANVINYPSNDSDWWAAGQVQPGRNSVEMVMVTNKRWNGIIHTAFVLKFWDENNCQPLTEMHVNVITILHWSLMYIESIFNDTIFRNIIRKAPLFSISLIATFPTDTHYK